jgi:hypothetical protein
MRDREPAVGLSHRLAQADQGPSRVEEDGTEAEHEGKVREADAAAEGAASPGARVVSASPLSRVCASPRQ